MGVLLALSLLEKPGLRDCEDSLYFWNIEYVPCPLAFWAISLTCSSLGGMRSGWESKDGLLTCPLLQLYQGLRRVMGE